MGFLRDLINAVRRRLNLLRSSSSAFSGSEFLCDTCKYAYGNVCNRPERPNAVKCPDYKKKK
jgi:hypothetical protein